MGISAQVAISMAFAAIIVTITVGEYERREATDRLNTQLIEQANLTVSLVGGLLIESIIIEDKPVLDTALQVAIDQNPKIHSIQILGPTAKDLAQSQSHQEHESTDLLIIEKPIEFEGEVFGTMIVEWSTREGQKLVAQNVWEAQISTAVTAACLSVIFILQMNQLILRPLSRIGSRMTSATDGQNSIRYSLPWFLSRELHSLNDSVAILEHAFEERDAREDKLVKLSNEKSEADRRERTLIEEVAEKNRETAEEQAKLAKSERRQLELIKEFNESVADVAVLAAQGNLTSRLALDFENEELAQTSMSINKLLDNIAESLGATSTSLHGLASGNLTERMDGEFTGIFKDLQTNVNTTFETLAQLISNISSSGSTVSIAAVSIETSANELYDRTVENASRLQQSLSAIDRIASTFQTISDQATVANANANDARELAQSGLVLTESAVLSMDNISNASKKIEGAINGVHDISSQIKMLAINARIEASRAGEFGSGFSVIAAEVGSLAQRSSNAVEEIEVVLQETLLAIDFGVNQMNEMANSIENIVQSTDGILDQIGEISGSIKPQSDQLIEIKTVLDAIGYSTQSDAKLCEELSATTNGLRDGSKNLDFLLERFQFEESGSSVDDLVEIFNASKSAV